MSGKRMDHITWDEYFMGIAVLSSLRSTRTHRSAHASSVLTRRSSELAIMAFLQDALMMSFHGKERETGSIRSILMYAMQS